MQRLAWGKVCVNELREALEAEGVDAGPEATCKGGLGSKGVPRTVTLEQPHESTGLGPADGGSALGRGQSPGGPACQSPCSVPVCQLNRVWKSRIPPGPLTLPTGKLRPRTGHRPNLGQWQSLGSAQESQLSLTTINNSENLSAELAWAQVPCVLSWVGLFTSLSLSLWVQNAASYWEEHRLSRLML